MSPAFQMSNMAGGMLALQDVHQDFSWARALCAVGLGGALMLVLRYQATESVSTWCGLLVVFMLVTFRFVIVHLRKETNTRSCRRTNAAALRRIYPPLATAKYG
jgi:hypothetical protein